MTISIITVVYNNAPYIEGCIKSVLSQSYSDIEYIIIDGKSTDGTLDIINRYRNKVDIVISEKDKGHIYAMNKGLKAATGDIVGFLHSDDSYASPNIIAKVEDAFKIRNVDSVYGDLLYMSKENPEKIIRYWKDKQYDVEKIRRGWMPAHPTFFVKKEIYKKYGILDTSFKIAMDYELILRFLYKHKISALHMPEVFVKMRYGGVSNRSIKNIIRKTYEDYRACRMYGLGIGTVLMKNFLKIPQFFIH